MQRAYVDTPEGHIHYLTAGSGEPLVLLHMFPASAEQYAAMIPLLARDYRVLAMDTPGFGNSFNPTREYEIADFAATVIAFLDALGISRANVIGHYTGAATAAELGAAFPERVDKLVLSGCPYWPPERWQQFYQGWTLPPITADGSFLIQQWQKSQQMSPQMTLEDRLRGLINRFTSDLRTADTHYAIERYDFASRLPLIKSPTLLMSGSRGFFRDRLEITAPLIPGCQTKVIEGTGPGIYREQPETFAATIMEFLHSPGG